MRLASQEPSRAADLVGRPYSRGSTRLAQRNRDETGALEVQGADRLLPGRDTGQHADWGVSVGRRIRLYLRSSAAGGSGRSAGGGEGDESGRMKSQHTQD